MEEECWDGGSIGMEEECWNGGGRGEPSSGGFHPYVKTRNGAKARWLQNGCQFCLMKVTSLMMDTQVELRNKKSLLNVFFFVLYLPSVLGGFTCS